MTLEPPFLFIASPPGLSAVNAPVCHFKPQNGVPALPRAPVLTYCTSVQHHSKKRGASDASLPRDIIIMYLLLYQSWLNRPDPVLEISNPLHDIKEKSCRNKKLGQVDKGRNDMSRIASDSSITATVKKDKEQYPRGDMVVVFGPDSNHLHSLACFEISTFVGNTGWHTKTSK